MAGKTRFYRLSSSVLIALSLSSCQAQPPAAPQSSSQAVPPATMRAVPSVEPVPSAAAVAQANIYRQQGLSLRQQGLYPDAIAALQRAVTLDPRNTLSYVILGWTHHLAGQEQAATQVLQQALQRQPNHVPALNALGIVYLTAGKLQAAVQTHTQAVQLKPNNEIAHYNLSLAYQRLQKYDQAIKHAQQAAALEPENSHPWVALAIAHWGQGNQSAAQQAYRQAMELDGSYGDRSTLAELKLAGFSPDQIQMTTDILTSL